MSSEDRDLKEIVNRAREGRLIILLHSALSNTQGQNLVTQNVIRFERGADKSGLSRFIDPAGKWL